MLIEGDISFFNQKSLNHILELYVLDLEYALFGCIWIKKKTINKIKSRKWCSGQEPIYPCIVSQRLNPFADVVIKIFFSDIKFQKERLYKDKIWNSKM